MKAQRRTGRILGRLAAVVVMIMIVLTARSGYFGGDVFMPYPAKVLSDGDRPRIAAVFVSGDVGMHFGMGQGIVRSLVANGTSVVAINSTAYFNRRRTPGDVTDLIADAAQHAMALGETDRVVLIGHSYGADMLQVGYAGLPPALRKKVAMVALIVPTEAIYLRISLIEMLGWSMPDVPASAVVHRLDGVPTLCIYGREEATSPCIATVRFGLKSVALPGGHGLHQDSDAAAATLISAVAQITNL